MIDAEKKLAIVTSILKSPEFKDSKRAQELLQYLVQATLDGKNPKEITVGVEFFGKDSSFDPAEDPTVRVQINNLRKKLEHYYLTTEKTFPYRLEIPKGHYVVDFVPADSTKRGSAKQHRRVFVVLLSTILILVVAVVYLATTSANQPDIASDFSQNPLWSEFFEPTGKPTLVILGDYLFLFDKSFTEKPGIIVRNPLINSLEDLRAASNRDPEFAKRFVQSEFTFLRPSAPWGIAKIIPILHATQHGITLKLASQLTVDDLKGHNVVFIGSFKTLHKLNRILHHFDLEYRLSPPSFTIRATVKDSAATFQSTNVRGGEYERDYAVIVKGVGPEGNTMMMILGFGDSGVLQAANLVADPTLPSQIEKMSGAESLAPPFSCFLVFEAEGINQTGFRATLRYVRAHRTM